MDKKADSREESPLLQWFKARAMRTGHPGSKKQTHTWHLRNMRRNIAKRKVRR